MHGIRHVDTALTSSLSGYSFGFALAGLQYLVHCIRHVDTALTSSLSGDTALDSHWQAFSTWCMALDTLIQLLPLVYQEIQLWIRIGRPSVPGALH